MATTSKGGRFSGSKCASVSLVGASEECSFDVEERASTDMDLIAAITLGHTPHLNLYTTPFFLRSHKPSLLCFRHRIRFS